MTLTVEPPRDHTSAPLAFPPTPICRSLNAKIVKKQLQIASLGASNPSIFERGSHRHYSSEPTWPDSALV